MNQHRNRRHQFVTDHLPVQHWSLFKHAPHRRQSRGHTIGWAAAEEHKLAFSCKHLDQAPFSEQNQDLARTFSAVEVWCGLTSSSPPTDLTASTRGWFPTTYAGFGI